MSEPSIIDWKNMPKAILFTILLIISSIWFLLVRVRTNIVSLQKRIFFFLALLSIVRILDAGFYRQVCYAGREYQEYCVWLAKIFQCIDIWSIPLTITIYFILMNFWGEKFYLSYCAQNQKHEEFIKIRKFMYNIFIIALILGNIITAVFSILIFAVPLNKSSTSYRFSRSTFRLLANGSVTAMIFFFWFKTYQYQTYGPGLKRMVILTFLMIFLNSIFPIYAVIQAINLSIGFDYMWILSLIFTVLEFIIYMIVLLFLTPDLCPKKEYVQSSFTTSLDQEEFFKEDDFDEDKSEIQ